MTPSDPSSDELVSAYLDGEATEAERARIEADPELRSRVETFRLVSAAVATPPPMPNAAAREAAIAAALGASNTTAKVTSMAPIQERRGRFSGARTGVLSAAAVILVLFLGGAIIGGLGGDDSMDTASDVSTESADDASDDFGGMDATSAMDDDSGDVLSDEAMADTMDGDDEEAMEEEAMEEEEEAMEDEAEAEEEAMEEAPADAAIEEPAEESADDGSAEESAPAVETRSFVSLAELTDIFTTEENAAEPVAGKVFADEVLEMADLCRTEPNESDTNSLVFLEQAILFDAEGAPTDVLVYRDDVIDADPFIRVFEFGSCTPIQ